MQKDRIFKEIDDLRKEQSSSHERTNFCHSQIQYCKQILLLEHSSRRQIEEKIKKLIEELAEVNAREDT